MFNVLEVEIYLNTMLFSTHSTEQSPS